MTRRIGVANRASRSVVTEMNQPISWAVHGIDGPIRALVDVTLQALDDARSSMSIDVDLEGHGIGNTSSRSWSDAKQRRRSLLTSRGARTGWSRAPYSGGRERAHPPAQACDRVR